MKNVTKSRIKQVVGVTSSLTLVFMTATKKYPRCAHHTLTKKTSYVGNPWILFFKLKLKTQKLYLQMRMPRVRHTIALPMVRALLDGKCPAFKRINGTFATQEKTPLTAFDLSDATAKTYLFVVIS